MLQTDFIPLWRPPEAKFVVKYEQSFDIYIFGRINRSRELLSCQGGRGLSFDKNFFTNFQALLNLISGGQIMNNIATIQFDSIKLIRAL